MYNNIKYNGELLMLACSSTPKYPKFIDNDNNLLWLLFEIVLELQVICDII